MAEKCHGGQSEPSSPDFLDGWRASLGFQGGLIDDLDCWDEFEDDYGEKSVSATATAQTTPPPMVMLSALPKFKLHSSTVSGRKPVATVPAAAVPAAAATVLAATAHALAGVRIRSTGGAKPVAKRTV